MGVVGSLCCLYGCRLVTVSFIGTGFVEFFAFNTCELRFGWSRRCMSFVMFVVVLFVFLLLLYLPCIICICYCLDLCRESRNCSSSSFFDAVCRYFTLTGIEFGGFPGWHVVRYSFPLLAWVV